MVALAIALADRRHLCGHICNPAVCLGLFCKYANFIALALASLRNVSHLLLCKFVTCISIALVMRGGSLQLLFLRIMGERVGYIVRAALFDAAAES